jgi:hypothetical protein
MMNEGIFNASHKVPIRWLLAVSTSAALASKKEMNFDRRRKRRCQVRAFRGGGL